MTNLPMCSSAVGGFACTYNSVGSVAYADGPLQLDCPVTFHASHAKADRSPKGQLALLGEANKQACNWHLTSTDLMRVTKACLTCGRAVDPDVSHSTSPAPFGRTLFIDRHLHQPGQRLFSTQQRFDHQERIPRNCSTRLLLNTNELTSARDVTERDRRHCPTYSQHRNHEVDRLLAAPPFCRHGHRCR